MEFDFAKQPGKTWKRKNIGKGWHPLMTIVTPFYNAGTYFEQTFHSVMNQTFPWFEWIIVDDGSDRAEDLDVLKKFASSDRRICIVRQKNRGLACARNTGIQRAHTDIIVPLDADDLLSPQYLEYTYFGLYYHPDAAWCYTDSVGFGRQQYLWKHAWNAKKMKRENQLVATAAIRKQAIRRVGGYKPEKWAYHEDWRFWLELMAQHQYPVHVSGYLFWYRRLDDGMLSGIQKDRRKKQFCERIIRRASKRADQTIRAVEYPIVKTREPYHRSQFADFWNDDTIPSETGKIRILMLVPWLVMGGADRMNLELVSGLDKSRFEISILTTVYSNNEWHSRFAQYTDEIFHLPDFLDPAHYMEYVGYYIRTRNIDLVWISNSYRGYYMIPWLRRQFPDLCIVDYVHMEEWYWKDGGFARLSGVFGAVLDKTYVCNANTRQVLVDEFHRDPDSIEVMYIGVDKEKFNPHKIKKGKIYHKFNISSERPIVLFPCRIDAQKRPFLMLEIARRVSRQMPQVLFVVVGDGPQRRALEKAVKKCGLEKNVICTGRSEHMEQYYQDARLTLICSLKEGISLTAYESCAMGTPVISSDVGGQKELIDPAVGMLIPIRQKEGKDFDERKFSDEEIQEYVQAIVKLLTDTQLYDRCSKNCRRRMEHTFTVNNMLRRMEQECTILLNQEINIQKRKKLSAAIKESGFLAEELYMVEMAEEERSMASAAVMSCLEEYVEKLLPQGSARRDQAVRIYRKWRK